MAYRSRKQRKVAKAEDGLVADMVRQFADRWAFVRELVQNGIDAGATELEVGARQEGGEAGRFWVRDDGTGMDRATIEGPLLTLFASAKDEDETKIGKYGVGFVSVFAVEPDEVVVDTWRADEAWRLRLFPDHRYELSHLERRPSGPSGTVVSLIKSLDADGFREATTELSAALRRWCRHAHLPIVWQEGHGSPQRVDVPVEVESPVTVRTESDGLVAVVGVAPDPKGEGPRGSYGFYHRGLTLIETVEPPHARLAGLRCKVDSAALKHTISRDNVRHDRAYAHALRQLVALAGEPLEEALVEALAREAKAVVEGDELGTYLELLRAAARMGLAPRCVAVPLAAPVEGTRCATADLLEGDWRPPWVERAPVLHAPGPSPIVTRVAARGHRVLLSPGPEATLVAAMLTRDAQPIEEAFALLEPFEVTGGAQLVARLGAHLASAGRVPPAIHLVTSSDAEVGRAAMAAPPGTPPFLVERAAPQGWSGRLGADQPVALVADHPAVVAALDRGDAQGAWLLSRYLLVEEQGVVSRRQADGLQEGEA